MHIPKLRNPGLCRVMLYMIVILIPVAVIAAVFAVSGLIEGFPDIAAALIVVAALVIWLIWLIRNAGFLLSVDIILAGLAADKAARERFVLTDAFSAAGAERRLSRFGRQGEPVRCATPPEILRFRSRASLTIYSYAVEKTVAVYHTDYLDRELYRSIVSSARTCSDSLSGKKKYPVIDGKRKKAPLNRSTVIVIFAKNTDVRLSGELPGLVSRNGGDGENSSFLPCVVDLGGRRCIFDSTREIYEGFGAYPAKNRGIRLIRKLVFGGKLPLAESPERVRGRLVPDTDQGLFRWISGMHRDIVKELREDKKRYRSMCDGEIVFEDGCIYLKWKDRAIMTYAELDSGSMTAEIGEIEFWDWPTKGPVDGAKIAEMKRRIDEYFGRMGYRTNYGGFSETAGKQP